MTNLPPMVQNCPNLFCVATRRPLSSLVIRVSCPLSVTVAYFRGGSQGRGCDSEILFASGVSAVPEQYVLRVSLVL